MRFQGQTKVCCKYAILAITSANKELYQICQDPKLLGHPSPRERLKYVVDINTFTPDWVNGAFFFKIYDEAGYVRKTNGYASCWLQVMADPTAIYCIVERPTSNSHRNSSSLARVGVSLDVRPLSLLFLSLPHII